MATKGVTDDHQRRHGWPPKASRMTTKGVTDDHQRRHQHRLLPGEISDMSVTGAPASLYTRVISLDPSLAAEAASRSAQDLQRASVHLK
jgi:hypothetical protein